MFLVLASGLGGSIRSLSTVLEGMTAIRRLVVCPAGSATARLLIERGLAEDLTELPSNGRSRVFDRLRATLLITRLARRERARLSAIHANGISELSIALLPALVGGCRVVVWVHEWAVPPWAFRFAPLLRRISRRVHFAAVSETSRQMVVSAGLADTSEVSLVVNPIDPKDVRSNKTRTPHAALRIAYLGAPATYKGFQLLPDLVRLTSDLGLTWTVYSGPETSMPGVFAELRHLGVSVRGKVSDVRMAYGSCDLVLVPSLRESFGRVAAEAMANGLPVVASDLPVLRELLGDNEAGLLVHPGDAQAFAVAIQRLVVDQSLRESLGREGIRRSSRFRPEPVVNALLLLYGVPA